MKKLNFLVEDVGASQQSLFLLKNLNALVRERSDICPTVFYANITDHCVKPLMFGMMQMSECFDTEGATIATSLTTAARLLSMPGPNPKLFYMFDLEWLKLAGLHQSSVAHIIRNPNLTIVVRSESHRDAVENCFNVKVENIIENFDINQFLTLTKLA